MRNPRLQDSSKRICGTQLGSIGTLNDDTAILLSLRISDIVHVVIGRILPKAVDPESDCFLIYMTSILPVLSRTPTSLAHADSSLSSTLIGIVAALLPHIPALTISIGCGHGVLEAYLENSSAPLDLLGIDVVHHVPQYIAETKLCILPGTFATSAKALVAEAWLFVYPKDLELPGRYVSKYGSGKVRIIVWIGPKMDWEDVKKGIPSGGWV